MQLEANKMLVLFLNQAGRVVCVSDLLDRRARALSARYSFTCLVVRCHEAKPSSFLVEAS